MPRPKSRRHVAPMARRAGFQPEHADARGHDVVLALEELEAIRLADREGLYQDAAAAQMRISRQTFGRILTSARRKMATALLDGRALRVAEPGPEIVHHSGPRPSDMCGCGWFAEAPPAPGAPCPRCRTAWDGTKNGVVRRRRRSWSRGVGMQGEDA